MQSESKGRERERDKQTKKERKKHTAMANKPPPELRWNRVDSTGTIPSRRSGHSFSIVDSSVFLFGGCTSANQGSSTSGPSITKDLFMLDVSQGNFHWSNPATVGKSPQARWHHTANVHDRTKIIIFGGFHSNSERFNDVWMLDTVTMSWSQPVASALMHKLSPDDALKGMLAIQPEPRGNHSSTIVGKHMVIFGGYGGEGWARRDFNDVYALDLETWRWKAVEPLGEGPSPRCGHSASRIRDKIFIVGGWDAHTSFTDLYILDTAPGEEAIAAAMEGNSEFFEDEGDDANDGGHGGSSSSSQAASGLRWVWSKVEGMLPLSCPRSMHCAVSAEAVPNWKLFIFGGHGADPENPTNDLCIYLNSTVVLDVGDMQWQDLKIVGKPPKGRADTEMVYDEGRSRLLFFGGWANRWFGDICTLPVAAVVGPPYCVNSISPSRGPIIGGPTCEVTGEGFVNQQVKVRFSSSKGTTETQAKFVDSTKISFNLPDLTQHKNLDEPLQVAVSCAGKMYSIMSVPFSPFAVTDAKNCIIFGPALVNGAAVGETCFFVQTRDGNGKIRGVGEDKFSISIKKITQHRPQEVENEEENGDGEGGDEEEDEEKLKKSRAAPKEELIPIDIDINHVDNDNGAHVFVFNIPEEGEYEIAVAYDGTFNGAAGPLYGSPYRVQYVAADGLGQNHNALTGPHMLKSLKGAVKDLQSFIKTSQRNLGLKVASGDVSTLLKVKGTMKEVAEREAEIHQRFDRLQSNFEVITSSLISDAGQVPLGKSDMKHMKTLIDNISDTQNKWQNILRILPTTAKRISPVEKAESNKVYNEATAYNDAVAKYKNEFKTKYDFWKGDVTPEAATAALDVAVADQKQQHAQLAQWEKMTDIFGHEGAVELSRQSLEQLDVLIVEMRKLWEVRIEVNALEKSNREMAWADVDTEELEDSCKLVMKKVRKLSRDVRRNQAFQVMNDMVKNFANTVPLVSILLHPSMRPRHWKMVMDMVGQEFTPPPEDDNATLGDMLKFELHTKVDALEELSDCSTKEAKMEKQLAQLGENWSVVKWFKEPYGGDDTGETQLLRILDDDFEMLENDQLTVQSLMGNRYLATFEEEVVGWQRSLAAIADVLIVLADNQRVWSYLEPLFMKSAEVQMELPEDAKRFKTIDSDFKKILKEAELTEYIKPACNKAGLYDDLEKIQERLAQCKKSLNDFLDAKRRIFPASTLPRRLIFWTFSPTVPMPTRIIHHVNKLFLATRVLELETPDKYPNLKNRGTGEEKDRPVAWQVVASVGIEKFDFEEPFQLTGKVEGYMQTVLDSMIDSLTAQMGRSAERYHQQERLEWLMDRHDTDKSRPKDACQVCHLRCHDELCQFDRKGSRRGRPQGCGRVWRSHES